MRHKLATMVVAWGGGLLLGRWLLHARLLPTLWTPLAQCAAVGLLVVAWAWALRRGLRGPRRVGWIGLGAGVVLGLGHGLPEGVPPGRLRLPVDQLVEGRVSEPPRRAGEDVVLVLDSVFIRAGPDAGRLPGRMRLRTPAAGLALGEGQRVSVWARLQPVRAARNPGVRDWAETLLARGIGARGRVGPYPRFRVVDARREHPRRDRVRAALRGWADRSLSVATARLIQAVILGDGGAVSSDDRRAWRDAGLGHLLAISGLHVGVVAWFLYRLVGALFGSWGAWVRRWSSRRPAAVVALCGIWAYVHVAGAPVSAVRAGCMLSGLLGATALGRGRDLASAWALGLLLVLAPDPGAMADPSFQLSFAAVTALVVGMAPVERAAAAVEGLPLIGRLCKAVVRGLGASLVCVLGTLPFVVWHFQAVPLGGLVMNVIAIPVAAWGVVVPGLLALGVLTLGLDPAWLGVHRWLEAGAHAADSIAAWSAEWMGSLTLEGATAGDAWLAAAVAVGGLLALRRGVRRWGLALAAAAVATGCVWRAEWVRAPPDLHLTFLAVGHGDATVVQLPGGFTLLVDAGGDPMAMVDVGERVVVPALLGLGVDRIDVMVLSHPHPDHYGGLPAVLARFDVGELWTSGVSAHSARFRAFEAQLRRQGVPIRTFDPGSRRVRVGDAVIEVLHPLPAARPRAGANDNSLVLRLRYGAFSVLLTGDVEREGEALLVGSGHRLRSTVLKVPHHGSRTSSSEPLLRAARPALAVAQANDFGHFPFPHTEVEQRYARLGVPLWITGRHGALQIRSDGERWWTHTW